MDTREKAHAQFTRLNVLVIEDVSSMRQLLAQLLKQIGFSTVTACEDGADALKRLESAAIPIDVIVCDLEMPIISGVEFIQMLRKHHRKDLAAIPLVVVTGHSEEKNLHKAVQSGIHGFLVKPVSRKSLESRIAYALKNPPITPEVFSRKRMHGAKIEIIEG